MSAAYGVNLESIADHFRSNARHELPREPSGPAGCLILVIGTLVESLKPRRDLDGPVEVSSLPEASSTAR